MAGFSSRKHALIEPSVSKWANVWNLYLGFSLARRVREVPPTGGIDARSPVYVRQQRDSLGLPPFALPLLPSLHLASRTSRILWVVRLPMHNILSLLIPHGRDTIMDFGAQCLHLRCDPMAPSSQLHSGRYLPKCEIRSWAGGYPLPKMGFCHQGTVRFARRTPLHPNQTTTSSPTQIMCLAS